MENGRKVAKYRQIADYLRERIIDGTFPPGQPLPSEEQLGKQFGVTRPTVRQGISELRAAGLVEVLMGRGMFVRSPQARPAITRPRGIRRDKDGTYSEADAIRWTTSEDPKPTRTDAPVALADLLQVPPGEPLLTYEQHQTADQGRLRQLRRTYVPFSVLAEAEQEASSPPPAPELLNALSAMGHDLRFTEYVRTRMPLPDEAAVLRLSEGVPLLQVLRVAINQQERALALEELRIPGDDLEISYAYAPVGPPVKQRGESASLGPSTRQSASPEVQLDDEHLEEAVAIYQRVANDAARVLGPDDPATLAARGNLAQLFHKIGRSKEALRLNERIVKDAARVLGPDASYPSPDLVARDNAGYAVMLFQAKQHVAELREATRK